jgi:predicted nucleic acid-binding protein
VAEAYLFDASALVDLVLGLGPPSVRINAVFDEHLLDLTPYEAGNALWKIRFANDAITDRDLDDALDVLERLSREVSFEDATGSELRPTMAMARKTGCTFYDASYLTIADREDLTLVSEDGPQRNAAQDAGISVRTLSDLANDHG